MRRLLLVASAVVVVALLCGGALIASADDNTSPTFGGLGDETTGRYDAAHLPDYVGVVSNNVERDGDGPVGYIKKSDMVDPAHAPNPRLVYNTDLQVVGYFYNGYGYVPKAVGDDPGFAAEYKSWVESHMAAGDVAWDHLPSSPDDPPTFVGNGSALPAGSVQGGHSLSLRPGT